MEGRLALIQSKTGYRFSVDALLLAQFATVRKADVIVDLGTGCGVLALLLLLTKPLGRAYGLEIQSELAGQARRNAVLNGFEDRMEVVRGDIRNPPFREGFADLVICNPPYRPARSGRINPDRRRAIARHEILASLDHILAAGKKTLKSRGRFSIIYPASRAADVMAKMRLQGLEPKRVRVVYPGPMERAKLILVEARSGGAGGLIIEPPIIGQGDFSV
jgi:tRNA1Val (adenine37-N6)-methyltransferase